MKGSPPVPNTERQKLIDQLIRHEGLRLSAYQDHLGYWTIGVGRLIDERRGGRITEEEARYLLSNDIARFEKELDERLPWWRKLNEVRQRVLCDMAFNLGVDGLLQFKNTLKLIEESKYEEASKAMLESKWASQVGKRAATLSNMMRDGVDT